MSDCIFCKIINGDFGTEFVYENEYVVVFKDINPKAPIHLLVVPKIHVASLNELEDIYKGPVENWKFVNTFTSVISKKYSKIERAILDLKNNGALYTDMSGSGSTVFGVFASEKDVETARNALSGSWNVCSCY